MVVSDHSACGTIGCRAGFLGGADPPTRFRSRVFRNRKRSGRNPQVGRVFLVARGGHFRPFDEVASRSCSTDRICLPPSIRRSFAAQVWFSKTDRDLDSSTAKMHCPPGPLHRHCRSRDTHILQFFEASTFSWTPLPCVRIDAVAWHSWLPGVRRIAARCIQHSLQKQLPTYRALVGAYPSKVARVRSHAFAVRTVRHVTRRSHACARHFAFGAVVSVASRKGAAAAMRLPS